MYKIQTELAQIGNRSEKTTGSVAPPIFLSTAYRHDGLNESTGFDYIRTTNPTRALLEQHIASLECGDQGFACSSGMAAIFTTLSIFKSGDELLVSNDLYGGTYRFLESSGKNWGLNIKYIDTTQANQISQFITNKTKGIFLETPTNPLMSQSDIAAIATITKEHQITLIVDNTFYTPLLQRPLELGADIVIHSATKYLGGHNDVLAGLIVVKGAELCEKVGFHHNTAGAVLSPFDSYLVMRGMKTLFLRMQKHEENAKEIVKYLKNHNDVLNVLYAGHGGMVSFRLKKEEWIDSFLRSLKLISFAESLGGLESFITYPATQTHCDIPEEIRIEKGVCNKLLRFSVGIESTDDLIADFKQALNFASTGGDT